MDGQWAGLTLMDHPSNLAFPCRLRVADGFPYVGFAPMRKTKLVMSLNDLMGFRYRIVVHGSKPTPQQLEAMWREFQKSRG